MGDSGTLAGDGPQRQRRPKQPQTRAPENPRYILDLLLSVIRVSVETVAIVKSLPALKLAQMQGEVISVESGVLE